MNKPNVVMASHRCRSRQTWRRARYARHTQAEWPTSAPIRTWDDAHQVLQHDSGGALERARLTFAATIAWGVGQLKHTERSEIFLAPGHGRDSRTALWLVGAREAMEGELVRNGYFVEALVTLLQKAYLLPVHLELVLIGPQMRTWERTIGPVLVRAVSGVLHEAIERCEPNSVHDRPLEGSRPDAAILFNSGIGTLIWPLVEQWLPTIGLLLSINVPILCTCFHEGEARGEEAIFGSAYEAHTMLDSVTNPFAHSTPLEVAGRHVSDARAAELAAEEEKEVAMYSIATTSTPTGGKPSAAAAGNAPPPPSKDRSNTWIKWVRGSSLPVAELGRGGSAQWKAEQLVATCAKIQATRGMDAWIAHLDPSHGRPGRAADESKETVACNAALLAEATKDDSIALLAYGKGARSALEASLAQWASAAASGGASRGTQQAHTSAAAASEEMTYAGQRAEERIVQFATLALQNIDRAVAATMALARKPSGQAQGHAPVRYRNVFRGEFINLRDAPSTSTGVAMRLSRGAFVTADATHGDWLRVVADDSVSRQPMWALLRHPAHGVLLERAL